MEIGKAPQGPGGLNITWNPTPNATPRRHRTISGAVIHYTAGYYHGAIDWFKTPRSAVSAHYVIGFDGEVTQMCRLQREAWHAGMRWGRWNPNRWTVGYELASRPGQTNPPFSAAQLSTLVRLLTYLYRLDDESISDERASATVKMPWPYLPDADPATPRKRSYWREVFSGRGGYIIGHSAVNSGKPDPGRKFPWDEMLERLRENLY